MNTFVESSRSKQPLIVKWNKIADAAAGPTPRPRHGHRGIAIKELMVVFGGGNEGIVDELHVYDVAKNKWFVPVIRGDIPNGFAAYGMVTDQMKVFIFGGMIEYGRYSNDMYELQTSRWEWRRLRVRSPQSGQPSPCPRLGHSFTLDNQHIAYIFGGLANQSEDPKMNVPCYLNDLYFVDLSYSPSNLWWQTPATHGIPPPPRESHSTVYFATQTGKEQLIIYGGMNGSRMNDVWILDLLNWSWSNPMPNGFSPLPRSLHTANVVGHRMFVFGGWVPLQPEDKIEQPDKEWKCTNQMAVLNLNNLTWEQSAEPTTDNEPGARAGHSAVVINKRIYIWSGRDGYKKSWNNQVCCEDLWMLEVEPPAAPVGIQLVRASIKSLEIQWTPIINADHYLLQIQKVEADAEQKVTGRRILRAMPSANSVRAIRPSTYRQPQQGPFVMMQPSSGFVSSYSPPRKAHTRQTAPHIPPGQTRTIIVQKMTDQMPESAISQQPKVIVVQQPSSSMRSQTMGSPQFVPVQAIQSQKQQTNFQASQEPITFVQNTATTTTTRTTYTAPVAPAIDQTMPSNILDEALNEAESFVDEQLQQKHLQSEQQMAPVNQQWNAAPDNVAVYGQKMEEQKEEPVVEGEQNGQPSFVDNKSKEEEEPVEQMRATPNDGKEESRESQEIKPGTTGGQEDFQPLSEDVPVEQPLSDSQLQTPGNEATILELSTQSEEKPDVDQQQTPEIPSDNLPASNEPMPLINYPSDVSQEEPNASFQSASTVNGSGQQPESGQQLQPIELKSQPQQDQQQTEQQPSSKYHFSTLTSATDQWFDVATLSENKCLVTHYMVPVDSAERTSSEEGMSPAQEYNKIMELKPGIVYKFRVCAFNSVGQSKWSPVNSFKTCMPGFPGAPSSIKITKSTDGAHISWEPPQTTNGHIIEYSVYLAMHSANMGQLAFVPVYIGATPNCIVNHQNLELAHIDANPKPAIIFRIAARNEKGYGPATQVRWLQDQRPMAMMAPMVPSQSNLVGVRPMGRGTIVPGTLKRPYPYPQQQQSAFHQQPQIMSSASSYYSTTSGGGTRIVQATAATATSTTTANVAMVQPQQTHQRFYHPTSPQTSTGQFVSPRRKVQHQQPSIQQAQQQVERHVNESPELHAHPSAIVVSQASTPPQHQQQIDPSLTVREYLTGGSGKRMRLE